VNDVSDPISELYGSRDYLIQRASSLTGNRADAEDAVQNAFISMVAGSSAVPDKVEKRSPILYQLVEDQCKKLVERREKRASPSGTFMPTADVPSED
jgi:DNA-directed RNA polymerase specialized sigma24 family protein